jgi:hypothetical protein
MNAEAWPAWLPDPLDADAPYPADYDALPLEQWRWQFLRRWPHYQADFAGLPAGRDDDGKLVNWSDVGNGRFEKRHAPPELGQRYCVQPMWKPDPVDDDARSATRTGEDIYFLIDPAMPAIPRHYLLEFQPAPAIDFRGNLERIDQLYASGFTLAVIDKKRPINEQMQWLRKKLTAAAESEGWQSAERGPQLTMYPVYLRALDAEARGIKPKVLVSHIEPYNKHGKLRTDDGLRARYKSWLDAAHAVQKSVTTKNH